MDLLAKEITGGKKTPELAKKAGSAYLFKVNNITMPMNNVGTMANVTIGGYSNGQYDGKEFLFSGGFIISGKNVDSLGTSYAIERKPFWAFGQATASRIEDVVPGRVKAEASDDNQIYTLDENNDVPFGPSWQVWADAVKLGADFYDGDNDGLYNPVDLNGNGKWDTNEDRPDLIADHTVWCVYNDGKASADRRWTTVKPQGIDIQQTVFAFRSAGLLGNMMFVRYRLINRGKVSDKMDSVYFGVWADPDLGDYNDDLVGSDTIRNGAYTWNDGKDNVFGDNAPCFYIDFFQGPISYIPGVTFTDVNANGKYDAGTDIPLDTARSVKGPVLGVTLFPGAKNVGLSSFVNYVQSDPDRGDPAFAQEARYYNIGLDQKGKGVDPCNDKYGTVYGMLCSSVNSKYWYSGDPNVGANGYGWIYTTPGDVRQMQNSGPFTLEKDKPVDIVVAYIVGRGTNAKSSISEAKRISDFAQFLYDRNFSTAPPPPAVKPIVRTTENTINLTWETKSQVTYRSKTAAYDVRFEGYEVYMYRTNSTAPTEGGIENAKLIARYDIKNNFDDILTENGLTGERTVVYRKGIQLDSSIYAQSHARLSLTIDTDPFTNLPLIKGKPYYIAIVGYALNHDAPLVPVAAGVGNYIIDKTAFIGSTANLPVIFSDNTTTRGGIRPGFDAGDPSKINVKIASAKNKGIGSIVVNEVYKDSLTGNNYSVRFVKDTLKSVYTTYWQLVNTTANKILLDNQYLYNLETADIIKTVEGITVQIVGVDTPAIRTPRYSGKKWYTTFDNDKTGAFYLGKDISNNPKISPLSSLQSNWIKYDTVRQIQIRFGPPQKAYRYVRTSTFGTIYTYAAGTTLSNKAGFVDVPFQVWMKDDVYGTTKQLTCAFLENNPNGTADGTWDPTKNINTSREYIIVFNRDYSKDSLMLYTGQTGNWAAITGWTPAAGLLSKNDSIFARNTWLDGMFGIGFQKADSTFFANGDTLTIPISYVIRPQDGFEFSTGKKGASLTSAQKIDNFKKVNVYPNPLFAFNSSGSYIGQNSDDAFVTFNNLPRDVTIKIYSLSGNLLRTLTTSDKGANADSPTLSWNLQNSSGLRVASGLYIAVVTSPGLGEKVLKFSIIAPQKQIQRY